MVIKLGDHGERLGQISQGSPVSGGRGDCSVRSLVAWRQTRPHERDGTDRSVQTITLRPSSSVKVRDIPTSLVRDTA